MTTMYVEFTYDGEPETYKVEAEVEVTTDSTGGPHASGWVEESWLECEVTRLSVWLPDGQSVMEQALDHRITSSMQDTASTLAYGQFNDAFPPEKDRF